MRPAPDFLPGANSRKWHSRQVWDPIGYIRVRSLSNPQWHRDTQWLSTIFTRSRPKVTGPERDQYDHATASLRAYIAARPRGAETQREWEKRSEALWDAFLEQVDGYLKLIQDRHIRAVEAAGASGR